MADLYPRSRRAAFANTYPARHREDEDDTTTLRSEEVGHPFWAALFGALAGGLGGFAMLATAQAVSAYRHLGFAPLDRLGAFAERHGLHIAGALQTGVAVAVIAGAVLGAGFGLLARRLLRVAPRLLFFSIAAPATWVFVQAFVVPRLGVATALPFLPLAAGALVYGVCLALAPPKAIHPAHPAP